EGDPVIYRRIKDHVLHLKFEISTFLSVFPLALGVSVIVYMEFLAGTPWFTSVAGILVGLIPHAVLAWYLYEEGRSTHVILSSYRHNAAFGRNQKGVGAPRVGHAIVP
ncbi:MAG: hypothetical protein ACREA0_06960, partial [bacterium]